MKPAVKISQRNVAAVMEHAKKYLLETPVNATLPGSKRPLSEGERLALAFLNASLTIANSLGGDVAHIQVTFDDSEASPI